MPISVPVPDKTAGDVFTETMWDSYIRDNVNKLLDRGHRVLTVAQFSALTGLEDGDEVYLEVDAANGVQWHLRYVAAEPTYKWRFLGGPALSSEVATLETTTSTTYVALTTAGPSVAIPRAGDYDVQLGGGITSVGGGGRSDMSYDIGGTGAVDADAIENQNPFATISRRKRKAALTSVSLVSKYKGTSAGTSQFDRRFLAVTPVRVRHDA